MNNSSACRRSPLGLFPGQPAPRLYDRVVEVLRGRHYRRRTEETYVHWIRRFLLFHNCRHPSELAEGDFNRFLTHPAMKENVAASTQNQALAGVLFLYEHVLERPLDRMEGVVRARKPKRLPVVLTREEVASVLDHLDGLPRLVCRLLYVKTTMIYTHVLNRGGLGVHSPLDRLRKPMSVEVGRITRLTGQSNIPKAGLADRA